MRLKDYYKMLNISRDASEQEIKKAYRALAMKYHPDKNPDNELAAAHFREVKEAYQVLSDPAKRSAYNQQRWYRQSSRKKFEEEAFTPAIILKKSRDLSHYISTLDSFRINRQSLFHYLLLLLSDSSVNMLVEWNDTACNRQIVHELLDASKPLPYASMQKVAQRLARIAGHDKAIIQAVHDQVKSRKLLGYWQKYQLVIILIITLILCRIIYNLSS